MSKVFARLIMCAFLCAMDYGVWSLWHLCFPAAELTAFLIGGLVGANWLIAKPSE